MVSVNRQTFFFFGKTKKLLFLKNANFAAIAVSVAVFRANNSFPCGEFRGGLEVEGEFR